MRRDRERRGVGGLAAREGEGGEEVTLMVRRVCGAVSLSFVSYEFGSNHGAASLQLPADARFEVEEKLRQQVYDLVATTWESTLPNFEYSKTYASEVPKSESAKA